MFMNQFKTAFQLQVSAAADFACLDTNGYPNLSAPTNQISYQFAPGSWLQTSDLFFIEWVGTGGVQIAWAGGASTSNITVVSGTGVSATGTSTLTCTGTNGYITFNLSAIPTQTAFYFYRPGLSFTPTFSGFGNLRFGRNADRTAINSATTPQQYFSSQALAVYNDYKPRVWRPMGAAPANNSNISRSFYKTNWDTGLSALAPATIVSGTNGVWAGNITGTDTYAASSPSGWLGLVDGATVQGYFSNTNTSISPTLNVNSTGAIRITGQTVNTNGSVQVASLAAGGINVTAGTIATLVYSSILNVWVYNAGGFLSAVLPIEFRLGKAKAIGCDYYHNFSHLYDDASITAEATYIKNNKAANRRHIFEWSNECWNPGFVQTGFCQAASSQLGYSVGISLSYQGKRTKECMDLVTTAWGGAASDLVRLANHQLGDTNSPRYLWDGQQLGTRTNISAISVGATTTVTATGHTYANGDQVYIGGQGQSTSNLPVMGLLQSGYGTQVIAATSSSATTSLTGSGASKIFFNGTAATAYINLNATAATTDQKSFQIPAGGYFKYDDGYGGSVTQVSIILASGSGNVTCYRGTDTFGNGTTAFTVANSNTGAGTFDLSGINSTGALAYVSGGQTWKQLTTAQQPWSSIDAMSIAPYFFGGQFGSNANSGNYTNAKLNASTTLLQANEDYFNGLTTQALNAFQTDLLTDAVAGFYPLITLAGIYTSWAAVLTAKTPATKKILCYEGGPQLACPTTAQLTAASLPNGTYPNATQANFVTFFTAFFNSAQCYAVMKQYVQDFEASGVADTPATLLLTSAASGPSVSTNMWNQVPGDIYTALTSPYQIYQSFKDYNYGVYL